MRTTVDIDDDLLSLVRSLATQRQTTMGQVISDLLRKATLPPAERVGLVRNGVPLFQVPEDPVPITLEQVNELRDGDEEL